MGPFFMFLASLLLLSIFILGRLRSRTSASRLPPGPWKLPLIGNIHNLVGSLPHRRLQALSLKFGPLMHLRLGELNVVIVSSPEAAKQVLKTHDVSFASRPKVAAGEIMGYGSTTVTFAPHGEYWRRLKKLLNLELLSPKRVQSFRSIREQVFLDAAKKFAANEGSPVNFSETVNSAVYDIVSMAALGNASKDTPKLLDIIKKTTTVASGLDIVDLYPSIELLQKFSSIKCKLLSYRRDADKVFDKLIRDHREANRNERGSEKEDILDTLLKHQDGGEFLLTTDNVKAVIMDILIAGSDTASTILNWAMAEMMKHPTIFNKAQQEVRDAFDDKGFVDESDLNRLEYLEVVIKETMRLHPPVTLVPRKCIHACEINGYQIPINCTIMVNTWAINRDPSHWNNPDLFHPERFLKSQIDYKGNHFEYIPFGGGRRICPGITFGIANVQLPLAMFLYYFDWKLPAEMKPEEVDMSEAYGLVVSKKTPLAIVPVVKRAISSLPIK